MFKNVVIYRFCKPLELTPAAINQSLAALSYAPPLPQQASSMGFVPPVPVVSGDAPYLHQIDGRWLFCLKSAVRNVKPAEIQHRINERAAEIERKEHRKVFRKERQCIKDDVLVELLPGTFPEERSARGYITPRTGLLVLEASSHNAAEKFLGILRQALQALPVSLPQLQAMPGLAMLAWLNGPQEGADRALPQGLQLGLYAALTGGEHGGTVTLNNEDPTDENAAAYREGSHQVAALELATDGEMAGIRFRLTSELLLKSIKSDYEVEVPDDLGSVEAQRAALIDAELVLFAGVLDSVWASLVAAFNGYADESQPATWATTMAELLGAPEGTTAVFADEGPALSLCVPRVYVPLARDEPLHDAMDSLYPEAVTLVRQWETAGIARLQRELRIGYNRAARLIETMEAAGIVAPANGDGVRVVITEVLSHAAV